jgi:predicted nuclease of predicted toxin-antitoxin system
VAEESVDGLVVSRLRHDGHNVVFIAEFDAGIGDIDVLTISRENDALLFTADKDFGDLVFRRGLSLRRLASSPCRKHF